MLHGNDHRIAQTRSKAHLQNSTGSKIIHMLENYNKLNYLHMTTNEWVARERERPDKMQQLQLFPYRTQQRMHDGDGDGDQHSGTSKYSLVNSQRIHHIYHQIF